MSVQSDLAEVAKCYCFDWNSAKQAVVYLLASKANLLSMTPAQLSTAAKCYCFNDDRWKSIVAYLLANEAGLSSTTPKALSDASKCYCFDDETWKRVVVYLLNVGGGGPCPQDMQVSWTPTNLKLGQAIYCSFSDGTGASTLQTFTFTGTTIDTFDCGPCSALTSVSLPNLTNLIPTGDLVMRFSGCPLLTSFSAPNWVPQNGETITLVNDALPAANINAILHACITNPTWGNAGEGCNLQGGTNAAPSGQGVADKATLIGRGATVNTN